MLEQIVLIWVEIYLQINKCVFFHSKKTWNWGYGNALFTLILWFKASEICSYKCALGKEILFFGGIMVP